MICVYFTFVLAANYVFCVSGQSEIECWSQEMEACGHIKKPDFPTTVDELRDVCRTLEKLADCLLPVRESCSDGADDVERSREQVAYIHDVCREDSEFFQVISSNLECLAPAFDVVFRSCRSFLHVQDRTQTSISHYQMEYEKETGYNGTACILSLWYMSCASIKTGAKCGFEVGNAVKDILYQFRRNSKCTENFIAKAIPKMDVVATAAILHDELVLKRE